MSKRRNKEGSSDKEVPGVHETCSAQQCDVCHKQSRELLQGIEGPTASHLYQALNHKSYRWILDMQPVI